MSPFTLAEEDMITWVRSSCVPFYSCFFCYAFFTDFLNGFTDSFVITDWSFPLSSFLGHLDYSTYMCSEVSMISKFFLCKCGH